MVPAAMVQQNTTWVRRAMSGNDVFLFCNVVTSPYVARARTTHIVNAFKRARYALLRRVILTHLSVDQSEAQIKKLKYKKARAQIRQHFHALGLARISHNIGPRLQQAHGEPSASCHASSRVEQALRLAALGTLHFGFVVDLSHKNETESC